jgi:hypothetical protein
VVEQSHAVLQLCRQLALPGAQRFHLRCIHALARTGSLGAQLLHLVGDVFHVKAKVLHLPLDPRVLAQRANVFRTALEAGVRALKAGE